MSPISEEFIRDLVKRLDMVCADRHHWVEEQQTGHVVCAWCGHCDGSCAGRPVVTISTGPRL